MNSLKIHALGGQRRNSIQIALCEQSFLEKFFGTDEQGVSGERGVAGIRRIAVGRRPERQDLPQTLSTGGEKIREAIRCIAKVADAETTWQRRRMKQDAAGPGKAHWFDYYNDLNVAIVINRSVNRQGT